MRTVEWKKRNGTMACHCIYTQAEADRSNLEYVENWRDGEIGDWVLTDDEHIVQVLNLYHDKAGRKLIHTCTTTTNAGSMTCLLDVAHKESRYSINGKAKNMVPKELTVKLATMCAFIASGMAPEIAYLMAYRGLDKINTPITRHIRHKVKNIMAAEVVKQEIKRTLGDRLDKSGMTLEWLLGKYKMIVDENGNESATVSALNKISQFHGLDGNKQAAPVIPALPQATIDKLAELGKMGEEPVEVEAELVTSGDVVEAETEEIKEEVVDNEEADNGPTLVGGFSVYSGPSGS